MIEGHMLPFLLIVLSVWSVGILSVLGLARAAARGDLALDGFDGLASGSPDLALQS